MTTYAKPTQKDHLSSSHLFVSVCCLILELVDKNAPSSHTYMSVYYILYIIRVYININEYILLYTFICCDNYKVVELEHYSICILLCM